MSPSLLMGCASSQGPRSRNEDSVRIESVRGFAVLADGMGGAAGGQEASEQTVEAASEFLRNRLSADMATTEIEALLKSLVEEVNRCVYQTGMSTPELAGMGSTLSLLLARDRTYFTVNVGDSRVYLVRDGAAHQITRDHSLVQERIDAGLIRPDQAASQPDRNVLTRAIGTAPTVEPFYTQGTMETGDTFVLTSDGVHGVVPEVDLAEAATHADPTQGAQLLVDRANRLGTRDNASAVVLHVAAPSAKDDHPSEPDRPLPTAGREARRCAGRRGSNNILWLLAGAALVLLALVLATF